MDPHPPPAMPADDYGSVVRDGLLPLLLLRVAADGVVTVDAVADRVLLDRDVGPDVAGARIEGLLPPSLARRLAEGVHEVVDSRALSVVDVSSSALTIDFLRLIPLGADGEGRVDLVLVLGEAASSTDGDALTGLPTRELLAERWAQAVANARRSGAAVSILFCDLDGFKAVNDRLGHLAGDRVLEVVADRLRAVVRDGDTVARYGGDEFAVVIRGGEGTAVEIARRIIESLSRPVRLDDGRLASIGVSVGAHTVVPADDGPVELGSALEQADRRMYEVKACGGGDVCLDPTSPTAPA